MTYENAIERGKYWEKTAKKLTKENSYLKDEIFALKMHLSRIGVDVPDLKTRMDEPRVPVVPRVPSDDTDRFRKHHSIK